MNSPTNAKELFNLRHAHACNVIERNFGVLKQRFRILLFPPHYPLDFNLIFLLHYVLSKNFILKTDFNEGTIPRDPYQSAYTPLPSNADNDNDGGFITDDNYDGNSEVKSHRINIANAMWESCLEYMANGGTVDSDDDFSE